jgi:hypothetical protein
VTRAKPPPGATQRPEQVLVGGGVGPDPGPVRADHVRAESMAGGKAECPAENTDPAEHHVPGHPGIGGRAGGQGQAVRAEGAQQVAAADPGSDPDRRCPGSRVISRSPLVRSNIAFSMLPPGPCPLA